MTQNDDIKGVESTHTKQLNVISDSYQRHLYDKKNGDDKIQVFYFYCLNSEHKLASYKCDKIL